VEDLLAHGATAVVLSLGMNRRLQVDPRTLDYLARRSAAAQ
jgi:predicted aspartyl protease